MVVVICTVLSFVVTDLTGTVKVLNQQHIDNVYISCKSRELNHLINPPECDRIIRDYESRKVTTP